MFLTGLLPIGLLQVWTSYDQGFWFARSADFYEMEFVQTLGNWRMVPDTIIIVFGAFPLLYFLLEHLPATRKVDESGNNSMMGRKGAGTISRQEAMKTTVPDTFSHPLRLCQPCLRRHG